MNTIQMILIIIGVFLIITGIFFIIKNIGNTGTNKVKMLGMEFETSNGVSALILILGVVLIVIAATLPELSGRTPNSNALPSTGLTPKDSVETIHVDFRCFANEKISGITIYDSVKKYFHVKDSNPTYKIIISADPGIIKTNDAGSLFFYKSTRINLTKDTSTPFDIGINIPRTIPKSLMSDAEDEFIKDFIDSVNRNFPKIKNAINEQLSK